MDERRLTLPDELASLLDEGGLRQGIVEALLRAGAAYLKAEEAPDVDDRGRLRCRVVGGIGDELIHRARLVEARVRLAELGQEVWDLEEVVTGERPATSPVSLPEIDQGCLSAPVPISGELRRYLAVAERSVVDADPVLALLCYGYASRLVADLPDEELPHQAGRAMGAAAARKFALFRALDQERVLTLRLAGLRGLANPPPRRA